MFARLAVHKTANERNTERLLADWHKRVDLMREKKVALERSRAARKKRYPPIKSDS